ncbi:hypothetical protein AKJ16_DCAP02049 [Drosera capensis]
MAAAAATSTQCQTILPFSAAATPPQLCRRIQRPSSLSFALPAKPNPSRLRISRRVFWVPIVSCINNEDSSEINSPVTKDHDGTGASFDLKLPRRRLLVQFTCNACDGNTKRLVNRLAYERGTGLCSVAKTSTFLALLMLAVAMAVALNHDGIEPWQWSIWIGVKSRNFCAGCLQHHKLVDNLELVVEYDLRNEVNEERMFEAFASAGDCVTWQLILQLGLPAAYYVPMRSDR